MPEYKGSYYEIQPTPTITVIEQIILQVSEGLRFIHDMQFVHRDVKPDNILIKRRHPLEVALSDYGWAASLFNLDALTGACGTLGFCAPEASQLGAYHTPTFDVFSLGATFFVMQESDRLKTENYRDLLANVGPRPPQHYPDLVQAMMAQEPEARPSLADCSTIITKKDP